MNIDNIQSFLDKKTKEFFDELDNYIKNYDNLSDSEKKKLIKKLTFIKDEISLATLAVNFMAIKESLKYENSNISIPKSKIIVQ